MLVQGDVVGESHFLSALGQRVDDGVNKSWAASGERGNSIDLFFFNFDQNADCAEDLLRDIYVLGGDPPTTGKRGRSSANCRWSVGEGAEKARVCRRFHAFQAHTRCQ